MFLEISNQKKLIFNIIFFKLILMKNYFYFLSIEYINFFSTEKL